MKLLFLPVIMCAFALTAYLYAKPNGVKSQKAPFGLSFLYQSSLGKKLRPLFTHKWFTNLAGSYADSSFSKRHIKAFIQKHAIDMNDAERPAHAYSSFNDFFTRTLKPTARPIHQEPQAIISPADGNVLVVDLSLHKYFSVKDKQFNLEEFVRDHTLAQQYAGGMMVIVRLAPWDYHRFHFPYDCIPSQPKKIKGIYESVHPLVYESGIQPLTENERQLITLTTPTHEMVMIPVGALCVGKITHTYTPHQQYTKGQEAGYFSFGGSTVVLLFKPNTLMVDQQILEKSAHVIETPIKMGEPLGYLH